MKNDQLKLTVFSSRVSRLAGGLFYSVRALSVEVAEGGSNVPAYAGKVIIFR